MKSKLAERILPIAAALSALATLACCLPVGVFGIAAVAAGVSLAIEPLRPWLLVLSVVLLGFGAFQVYRTRATAACRRRRRSRASLALLWISVAIVIAVLLFPQLLAGMLADYFPS